MSLESEVRVMLVTLSSYPEVAYTVLHMSSGSASCDVAILFFTFVASSSVGYTSKCTCGQRPGYAPGKTVWNVTLPSEPASCTPRRKFCSAAPDEYSE